MAKVASIGLLVSNFRSGGPVSIAMLRHFSFRIFLVCLVACGTMALGAIWFDSSITSPVYFESTATLFIVGLASFLIWFSLTLVTIRELLQGKDWG